MFGLVRESRLKTLQKEYDELRLRLDKCREIEGQNEGLRKEINNQTTRIKELKGQIREQTEADLFFTSAKIQKKLLDGEPKENVRDLVLAQNLYQQNLAAQQQPAYQSSIFSLFGGLGNIYGRY